MVLEVEDPRRLRLSAQEWMPMALGPECRSSRDRVEAGGDCDTFCRILVTFTIAAVTTVSAPCSLRWLVGWVLLSSHLVEVQR